MNVFILPLRHFGPEEQILLLNMPETLLGLNHLELFLEAVLLMRDEVVKALMTPTPVEAQHPPNQSPHPRARFANGCHAMLWCYKSPPPPTPTNSL